MTRMSEYLQQEAGRSGNISRRPKPQILLTLSVKSDLSPVRSFKVSRLTVSDTRQFCCISCVKRLRRLSSSAVWLLCLVHSDWSDWQAHPVSAVCLFCDHQSETMDQIYTHMKVQQRTVSGFCSTGLKWFISDVILTRCLMQENIRVGFWTQEHGDFWNLSFFSDF